MREWKMKWLTNYWAKIRPSYTFLKETLQAMPREEIEKLINQKVSRDLFDPLMLRDSSEFLRLSVINLLGYKYLVCGNYLAWGRVTIYYSQFYVVNCLLRLKGFALAHLNFFDGKPLTIRIDRVRGEPKYRVQKCSSGAHQIIWKRFSELYPDLSSEEIGRFSIIKRIDWNYDLFYASQTTGGYALEEAKDRCQHNFLNPKYGLSSSAEQAEYYENLMANFGYEEAGTGDYIKYAIKCFSEIGKVSKYKDWYTSFFGSILHDIDVLKSKEETKDECEKWVNNALSRL